MYRVGFKTLVKALNQSCYSFFDVYYDDAVEAYNDTLDCENEEKEVGIVLHGYYILQDCESKRVYSLDAFKKIVLDGVEN